MIFPTCQPATLFLARTVIFTQISPRGNPEGSSDFVPLIGIEKEKIIIVLSVKTPSGVESIHTGWRDSLQFAKAIHGSHVGWAWGNFDLLRSTNTIRTCIDCITSNHTTNQSPFAPLTGCTSMLLHAKADAETKHKGTRWILSFELWISQPAHVCQHPPVLMPQMACRGQLVSK